MKAVRIHAYGGNEVLRLEDLPIPQPGADEVLVRVASSSINPIDWATRLGYMDELPLPYTLGWDVAGVVEQIGADITHLAPGDPVYGMIIMRGGAYAEYALLKGEEAAPAPASVPLTQAGGIPAGALTAWQAVHAAGIKRGSRALIIGGAGGVGHFAVQIAVHLGAEVWSSTSTRNLELVRSLGAHHVIDYTTTAIADAVNDLDAAVDTVSYETAMEALPLVRRGGALIGIIGAPDADTAAPYGVRTDDITVMPNADELRQIAALIDSGAVRLVIDSTVTLETLADGFARSESRRVSGKIVVQV